MGEAHCMSLGVCYGMAWHVISYGRIECLAARIGKHATAAGRLHPTSTFSPRSSLGYRLSNGSSWIVRCLTVETASLMLLIRGTRRERRPAALTCGRLDRQSWRMKRDVIRPSAMMEGLGLVVER